MNRTTNATTRPLMTRPLMTRPLMTRPLMTMTLLTRPLMTMTLLTMLVAGCGTSTSDTPSSTAASATASPASTESTESTAAGVDGGRVTTTTNVDDPDSLELIDELILEPGRTYRLGGSFGAQETFTIVAPDEQVYTDVVPGLVGLWANERGDTTLVHVLALATAITFSETSPDASQILTPEDLVAITAPTPDDPLGWMASRGYVDLGPVEDIEFSGFPARAVDYEFVEIDGGVACYPPDPRPCIWTFGSFDTSLTYFPGERGRFIDVDVAGTRYLIDVRDVPGAEEIAASMTISAVALDVPAGAADARDIAPVGAGAPVPATPGTAHRWTAGDGRWYRFVTPPDGDSYLFANRPPQGPPFLSTVSSDERLDILTPSQVEWIPEALDVTATTATTFEEVIAYVDGLPRASVPGDLVAGLRELPHLVVTEAGERRLGDVSVVFVDVTVAGGFAGGVGCLDDETARCVYPFGTALPLGLDETLRIGTLSGDGPSATTWYLMSRIPTGVETPMLDSLTIHDL